MEICFKCFSSIENKTAIHGLHEDCFRAWFNLSINDATEFQDIILRLDQQDTVNPINSIHASFFQGKFKKYSAALNNHPYILKVQDKDYPELPRVEYLSNQIAQKLGIVVPKFYLICFLNEVDAFVVHNFMENYQPGNLIHLYHFIKEDQSFSCRTIIQIIEEKIGRINAVKQFVFLCLFDALIGNHDRHGRNIAFIETTKGLELAPFYDNPSYIGIEDQSLLLAQHNPRGKIETSLVIDPTLKDYVHEFIQMGYQTWIQEFIKNVYKANVDELTKNSFLSEKRKEAFLNLVMKRIQEFDHVSL